MKDFTTNLSPFNMDGGFVPEIFFMMEYNTLAKIIRLNEIKLGSEKELKLDKKYLIRRTESFRKQESIEEGDDYEEKYAELYHIPEKKCFVEVIAYNSEANFSICYVERELVKDIEEKIKSFPSSKEEEKRKAGILMRSGGGTMYSRTFAMGENADMDIELNYGKDFLSIYNKLISSLTKKSNGMVLFHGIPGTGKTSLIRKIIKNVDKEFVIVPANMGEVIASPEFSAFLYEHTNCVLVIEDAEKLVYSREGIGSSAGVANILNLTDGIMGDCLGVQIIATFNTKRDNIDPALLRKGRLIVEHEFKALSIEDSNKLLTSLKKTSIATKPMTLAEIYNVDEEAIISEKKMEAVGFKF